MTEQALDGVIFAWMEQGMEGYVWAFQDGCAMKVNDHGEPAWSYEGLHVLEDGDHLTVFNIDDTIRWQGVISLDREMCRDPDSGSQVVMGAWVHGVQRGVSPVMWMKMFNDEPQARLVVASRA